MYIPDKQLPMLNIFYRFISLKYLNLEFPKRTMLGVCNTCTALHSKKIHTKSLLEQKEAKTAMKQHTAEVQ